MLKRKYAILTLLAITIAGLGWTSTARGAAANHFIVTAPVSVTAGVPFSCTVQAFDTSGKLDTTYHGSVVVAGAGANAPGTAGTAVLTNGTGTCNVTLTKTAAISNHVYVKATDGTIVGQSGWIAVVAGPPSVYFTVAASFANAGQPFSFKVTAKDQFNNVCTNYNGTVHFSSTNPHATYPPDSALVNGLGTFSETMFTAGAYRTLVTDAFSGAGTSNSTTITAVTTATVDVQAPPSVVTDSVFHFTVTARDIYRNIVNIPQEVNFSLRTNAPRATLDPTPDITGNGGVGHYSGKFTVVGTRAANFKITATDSVTGKSGTSAAIAVTPLPTASVISVVGPSVSQAGGPFNFFVTAKDADGNVETNYTGTLHFTSTDGGAILPADAGLTNGFGAFSATLNTKGDQTITATDTVNSSLKGVSNPSTVLVATSLRVSAPSHITSGVPFDVTVTAYDSRGQLDTGYHGTVKIYSNAGVSTLPVTTALVNGTATVSVTISGNSSYKISAFDVSDSSLHGTSASVSAGP